jgi:hypothetical protein
MKTHRNRFLAMAAIGIVAIGTFVSQTAAQTNSAWGSFTLPYEVNWKGVVLPAGNYTFSLKTRALPAMLDVRGPNRRAFIMATVLDEKKADHQNSSLTIEGRGGTRFVREMYLADIDLRICYAIPKAPQNEKELAQGPATTEHVAVSIGK